MSVDELRHSRPLENGLDVFLILNTLPVRALLFALCSFIMCICFATYYLAQNRAEIFLNFEHPTCPPENTSRKSCILTCRRTPSQIHPFHIPDAIVSRPRRDRLSSQTRTRLLPETNASGPTFAKRHRHKIVDDKSLVSIVCPSVLNL